MPTVGSTIGPYRIERELGRGGMGVVYLATDTRLDRMVAIKSLPDHLVADPDRLARFEREAKIVASLHHPGIAAVYALEHDGPTRFLVMEYVEGETLSERLKRGPIPVDDALPMARAIAEALEAAHEKGIVHRDLKPGNVMLTPEGDAKVLDFGLARSDDASLSSASGPALSQSPTVTNPIHSPTIPGAIMGTAGYMSPEQARGKAVDKRSDIFSFGCVLFEMLTGDRPFLGESIADALGATLHTDLDLGRLPPSTPPRVRALLARCLQKDPRSRLRDIGEARIALSDHGPEPESVVPGASSRGGSRAALALLSIVALAIGVAGGIGIARSMRAPMPKPQPLVASILTPRGVDLGLGYANPTVPRVSPDGRYLLFGGRDAAYGVRLFLTDLRTGTTRAIEGTENSQYPFWSPDSRSIGFFVMERGLFRIDIAGGAPRSLDSGAGDGGGNGKGGAWNAAGTIVYSPGPNAPLYSIDAGGENRTPISHQSVEDRELSHRHPFFLPRGDVLLYVRRTTGSIAGEGPAQIWVRTLDGSIDRMLVESVGNAVYSRGHVLYVVDGSLVARPFDEHELRFTGEARRIVDSVLTLPGASLSVFDATAAGALAYVPGDQSAALRRLVWRDRSGAQLEVLRENSDIRSLRLIGDGSRMLVNRQNAATNDIVRVIIDLATERERSVEETLPSTELGCISPDGTRYASWTNDPENTVVLIQPVDALARPEVVARIPLSEEFRLDDWTADGAALLGTVVAPGDLTNRRPVRIELDGTGTITDLSHGISDGFFSLTPSPDGKWMTFERVERNQRHIYLMPADHPEAAVRLTDASGSRVRWRADSRELYFLGFDSVISAVSLDVDAQGKTRINAATRLFDLGLARDPTAWVYDVAPDGQRFLVSEPMSRDQTQDITIMTDWVATMNQK